MSRWYKEEPDGSVKEVPLMEGARAFENTDSRRVGYDELGNLSYVSTVFLGLDHSFLSDGPPVLYETMIFNGPYSDWQDRYHTRAEALEGHNKVVARLRQGLSPDEATEQAIGYKGQEA